MGESPVSFFEPDFNRSVKVETADQRLTSHAGAVLLREFDHQLGLTESLGAQLFDPRRADRIRYTGVELLRERLYALAMGDQDQDDLDRLAHDPAMRMATWDQRGEEVLNQRLASQPTQSRLIDWLSNFKQNKEALRNGLCDWMHRHMRSTGRHSDHAVMRATIDIDSFPISVHGQQQGTSYNGYYKETVYHPLVASFSVGGQYDTTRSGMRLGNGFIHAILRQGNVHTADGMKRFVRNVIDKARQMARSFDMRLDAGYTHGSVMDELTKQNVRFCGRIKKNKVLERLAEPHLKRPPGRPPADGYQKVIELGKYQAEDWEYAQRLILVVIDEPDPVTGQLNLMPRYFFLVTNWPRTLKSGEQLLTHYRQRGTFEDRLGEFNEAIGAHLSSPNFDENEVTMLLAMLGFNLASMLRNELEDALGSCWDLHRFQQSVLRAGGRVVKGSRRLWLCIEESVKEFWQVLCKRIKQLRLPKLWTAPRGAISRRYVPPPSHAHQHLVLRD